MSLFLVTFKSQIVAFYTDSKEVQTVCEETIPYLALHVFFDCQQTFLGGIIRALGVQFKAFVSLVTCVYCVGLPLGLVLAFTTPLQLRGVWLGSAVGYCLAFICYAIVILKSKWVKLVE